MNGPELSILIASRNRREKLRRCLESLAEQSEDAGRFEVIVASDGSTDGTAEMVEDLRMPFPLRLVRSEGDGKAPALNAAIEAAAGPACLFIDDDIVASARLVAEHLAAHRGEPMTLGIGRLTQPPPSRGDWFGKAHAAAWDERYDELAARRPGWPDTYGGNFSAPRQVLVDVGGFATDLEAIEDIELGYRLCEAGCRPRYLPQAHGVHEDEKPRRRLLADVRRYGEFCARFAERIPATRPKLLGWFLEPTPRDVTLRRLLLSFRASPALVASLGALVPGESRKRIWFGFVSRYTFWLGARSAMSRRRWAQTTRGVPVLMYHAFGTCDEGDRYVTPRRSFARQLRLLRALRYRSLSFEELARALRAGEPPPPRSVVLTIDDGYADNLDIAAPLLRRHGFAATLFLVSRRLGGVNDWTREGAVAGRPLLTVEQVEALERMGVAVGAHTRTHPSLTAIDGEQLDGEVAGSREDLEQMLGEPIATFAYPYGRFDERAVAAAATCFDAACTVESRLARLGDDPLQIPRLEIRGNDRIARFLRKLWFGGA